MFFLGQICVVAKVAIVHREILPNFVYKLNMNFFLGNIFLYFWLYDSTIYRNFCKCFFNLGQIMANENLKMHIGLALFIFNIASWLYVVNQNKELV